MSPDTFCASAPEELADETPNDGWVRGARGLCELYENVDAQRFELILVQMAAGRAGSAWADGGRWLLARWQVATKLT